MTDPSTMLRNVAPFPVIAATALDTAALRPSLSYRQATTLSPGSSPRPRRWPRSCTVTKSAPSAAACRKSSRRPIPFDCNSDVDHSGACSPSTTDPENPYDHTAFLAMSRSDRQRWT